MKIKSYLVIVVLFTLNAVYSLDIERDEYYVTTDIAEGIAVTPKELIHIREDYDDVSIVSRKPRPPKLYNAYGFLEYQLNTLHAIVVEMNGLFITTLNSKDGNDPLSEELESNIASLSASSELIENINGKETTYKISNVLNRLGYEKEIGYYIYSSGHPWAADLNKDPNPAITIEVYEAISSFYILNGYVDFNKQSLFFYNARAKKIQVIDNETNTVIGDYDLLDKVIYQLIELPKAVKKFQIRIIENYPGRKYSDLCISSLYLNKANKKLLKGNYGVRFYNDLKIREIF